MGGKGDALVGVLPGREHQQTALGAGIKLLTLGFRQRREAVAQNDNGGEMEVESTTHDKLFTRRDGGGDEHRALLGRIDVSGYFGLQPLAGETARNANRQPLWGGEQGAVANAVVDVAAQLLVEEGMQQVGPFALHQEAPRVVAQVLLPALVFIISFQQQVVVAGLKKQAMFGMATFLGLLGRGRLWGLLRLSRNRQWINQPAIGPPAAGLKAPHDATQPACQRLADEQDAMQVVGHHLQAENSDFRVIIRYVVPLVSDGASQLRQLHAGVVAAAADMAKERPSPFNHHRQHVDAGPCVVVSHKTSFHRWLLFASECFLAFIDFFSHAPKVRRIT